MTKRQIWWRILLKVPRIGFEKIDNQSLVNCQENCLEKVLKGQSQKLYLMKKIQNTVEAHDEFNGMWKIVVKMQLKSLQNKKGQKTWGTWQNRGIFP